MQDILSVCHRRDMEFEPGDHLRDHRRRYCLPYTHHALMARSGQVVEFGGSTADKAAMGIACAALEEFAKGSRVDVVQHGGHNAELAVRRAEWLVSNPPPRSYNGIGFNCEHVARWCATGWETESLQIRYRIFGGKYLAIGLPLTTWLAWLYRTGRPMPRWAWLLVGANLGLTASTQFAYHNGIRHFSKHIREHCPPELRGGG